MSFQRATTPTVTGIHPGMSASGRNLPILLQVAFLFLFLPGGSPASASAGGGKIRTPPAETDIGNLFQGQILAHEFAIRNEGGGELTIHKVELHCHCLTALLASGDKTVAIRVGQHPSLEPLLTLPPHGSAKLTVRINSTDLPPRHFTKHITFLTDDPDHPRQDLTFQVTVRLPVMLKPTRLDFGTFERGTSRRRSVLLSPAPDLDLKLVRVKGADSALSAHLVPPPEPAEDGVRQLDVIVAADAPLGLLVRSLRIVTDDPRWQDIRLPVLARIVSAVRFDTNTKKPADMLRFGLLTGKNKHVRSVQIVNTRPSVPYRITGVTVVSGAKAFFTTHTEVLEPGVRYRVDLIADPALRQPAFSGTLVIHAEHPDQKEKVIHFRGRTAR